MIGDGCDVLEQNVEMGMSLASPPCKSNHSQKYDYDDDDPRV